MTILRRPVPPIDAEPDDGFLGYLVVTAPGSRLATTHTTLMERDTAEQELAHWRQQPQGHRYRLAEVRVTDG